MFNNRLQMKKANLYQIANYRNFEKAAFDRLRVYQLMFDGIYISLELRDKFISEYKNIEELEFTNDWPAYG